MRPPLYPLGVEAAAGSLPGHLAAEHNSPETPRDGADTCRSGSSALPVACWPLQEWPRRRTGGFATARAARLRQRVLAVGLHHGDERRHLAVAVVTEGMTLE